MFTEIEIDPDIMPLVGNFVEARKQDLNEIERLSAERNFTKIAKICHKIKGFARPYGFPTLETLSKDLELACRMDRGDDVAEIVSKMQGYLERFNTQPVKSEFSH